MVYELVVAGDTRSILDILSRYRSIVNALEQYLSRSSAEKVSFR